MGHLYVERQERLTTLRDEGTRFVNFKITKGTEIISVISPLLLDVPWWRALSQLASSEGSKEESAIFDSRELELGPCAHQTSIASHALVQWQGWVASLRVLQLAANDKIVACPKKKTIPKKDIRTHVGLISLSSKKTSYASFASFYRTKEEKAALCGEPDKETFMYYVRCHVMYILCV